MTYYLIMLEHCDGDYMIAQFDDMKAIKHYVKRERMLKDDYTVIYGYLPHHFKNVFDGKLL